MAMQRHEKLGKFLEKASQAAKKADRLNIKVIKVEDLDDIEYVKTGNLLFDELIGGFPRGRYSLIFGGPKVGKSTLVAQISGHVTNSGLSAIILEPENRAEKKWMLKFMDGSKVFITQVTGLGVALDSLVQIVESGLVDIAFVDSLSALAVKELKAKGTEGDHMALVARRMPQFFQMATEAVAKTQTAIVFVHQKRDSLDMYSGELETYSGGNALKHMLSLVLNMRRASAARDADKGERFKNNTGKKIGFMTNFKCTKATTGSIQDGDSIQIDFMHGQGFISNPSILYYAIRNKIMTKPKIGVYNFTDKEGIYEQRGLTNVLVDIDKVTGLRERILNKCKAFINNDKIVLEDIAPDLEFEKEMIVNEQEAKDVVETKKTCKTENNSTKTPA